MRTTITFERLVGRRLDLLAVDAGRQTVMLGWRLQPYLLGVTLKGHSPTVRLLPLNDLSLEDCARAACATKRARTALARVVIEDSRRGAFYLELRETEAESWRKFAGYRLRDPITNRTWLRFGMLNVHNSTTPSLHTVFDFTPGDGTHTTLTTTHRP